MKTTLGFKGAKFTQQQAVKWHRSVERVYLYDCVRLHLTKPFRVTDLGSAVPLIVTSLSCSMNFNLKVHVIMHLYIHGTPYLHTPALHHNPCQHI